MLDERPPWVLASSTLFFAFATALPSRVLGPFLPWALFPLLAPFLLWASSPPWVPVPVWVLFQSEACLLLSAGAAASPRLRLLRRYPRDADRAFRSWALPSCLPLERGFRRLEAAWCC